MGTSTGTSSLPAHYRSETALTLLTIFTTPKPFRGHEAVIQANALGSWVRLHPAVEVILIGEEHGAREFAAGCALAHGGY